MSSICVHQQTAKRPNVTIEVKREKKIILLTWLVQTKKTFRQKPQNTVGNERSISNWHLKYEIDNKALPSRSYRL
jgi:hypothetical protein